MFKHLYIVSSGIALALIAAQPQLHASENDWLVSTDLTTTYGNYSGSVSRSSLISSGLVLRADYLEKGGFALGGNYTVLSAKGGANNINQQGAYASGHYNLYFDALPGPLTLRLDAHAISNNDLSRNTDNVSVFAPQLSFLNYGKNFYFDLGYAYSTYRNNLKVQQFTPTLGFGFNDGADWIQARTYLIKPSNAARAQNKSSTTALDAKWMHWFTPGSAMMPEKLIVAGLAGERIYAVDGDAATVYNLTDVQRGSASLGVQWKLSADTSLLLMAGNEAYSNNLINNRYNNRFAHLNISTQW
ncbi:MAG: hypothetical protein CO186_10880 [Zetaproteobacteria bacterium CG_4_9_14_3_um_filter_49_83]|nr:MAG: hypothetical protein COW62_05655 [Zetaproteobacteria bacterium CG17_big_fil_post_rev_8_21_14_2_50_50_13]PIV31069.1 MAG: hypothetical protein COS35_03445 [Zetaproteobacteria bacterium CG02_land_8_20_14_3_00_50_9]PIY57062.1 MAG: hypothetical protein COZ00_00835 [Zetaproteobacteria bacterium CG_4_10_14_0_8_um_filter_49_80]PJA34398.1 MAG: hypothetical protein CO186_10880 [Zetaproteobacteria bacterium CG_4_9_14_3_um_filter_49_83]